MSKISELSDGGSLISSDYLIAVRSGGNVKVRMDQINVDQVDLGDNEFIRLGNSQDLTMVHNATNSIINQAGIGDLLIQKAGSTKLTINASGIDVTGTVTADGLVVANTSVVAGDFDGGTAATYIRLQDDTDNFLFGSNNSLGNFLIKNETADALRLSVANTGDISFYEDTGTTAKLFWDASAESLGIGTISPTAALDVRRLDASGLVAEFHNNIGYGIDIGTSTAEAYISSGYQQDFLFKTNAGSGQVERMRIDASGHAIIPAGVTLGTAVGVYNAAKTLDDYEEGTWTPAAVTTGYTISTSSAKYTKIGRLVTLHFNVTFSAVPAANSSCEFSGQPFESTTNSMHQPGIVRESQNTGAIYVLQANHNADRILMNSMDGSSAGSNRTIRINEEYSGFVCYTTSE